MEHPFYGTLPDLCACGYADCDYLAFGYPLCVGCGEHHRTPIAEAAGDRCPVDVWAERWDATDGDRVN